MCSHWSEPPVAQGGSRGHLSPAESPVRSPSAPASQSGMAGRLLLRACTTTTTTTLQLRSNVAARPLLRAMATVRGKSLVATDHMRTVDRRRGAQAPVRHAGVEPGGGRRAGCGGVVRYFGFIAQLVGPRRCVRLQCDFNQPPLVFNSTERMNNIEFTHVMLIRSNDTSVCGHLMCCEIATNDNA